MITVIKLGGSLFDLPDFAERIEQLLGLIAGPKLIIPGGGALADVVRDWDATHSLGEVVAHNLAMQTMRVSAQFVASLNVEYQLITSPAEVNQVASSSSVQVLDASQFELPSTLPRTWELTSDSIAAYVASQFHNSQLVMAKSVDVPHNMNNAIELGQVDPCFAGILKRPLMWVNLRSDPLVIEHVNSAIS